MFDLHFKSNLTLVLLKIFQVSSILQLPVIPIVSAEIPTYRIQRPKRDLEGGASCFNDENLSIFCPFKFKYQLDSSTFTTEAEVALCEDLNESCPKPFNNSVIFDGCSSEGCGIGEQCKALGESCFKSRQKSVLTHASIVEKFTCCDGKLVSNGKKIPVVGVCSGHNYRCIPAVGLNTVCGDNNKEYLGCAYPYYCGFPTIPRTYNPKDNVRQSVTVVKGNSRFTIQKGAVGLVQEPKRCLAMPKPCEIGKSEYVNIYCGFGLPNRYAGYPFCSCPTSDMKVGYHCVGSECKACKLQSVGCKTTSECCIHHTCENGKCKQCYPTEVFSKNITESCENKEGGGCCTGSDVCKIQKVTSTISYFCSPRPELGNSKGNGKPNN